MIWQPEFTDKTLSRKTGAVHNIPLSKEEEVAVSVMTPFSEVAVKSIPAYIKTINVETINDWGNVEHYFLKGE
ncbi:hypothetical protein [Escherichia coli]|uniref:hypothetical protein n=1 Tax=Escherichia coli TaxID=562 RepID=UPI0038B34D71